MTEGLRDQIRRARDELRAEGLSLNPLTAARVMWRALKREHASPARLAVAVGLGVFIGSLPVYPHLLISIVAAIALRLNKLVAALTTNISNPLFAPFLIFAEIQVGTLIRTGHFASLTFTELRGLAPTEAFKSFFLTILVGAPVVGVALSLVTGGLTYAALLRHKRRGQAGGG